VIPFTGAAGQTRVLLARRTVTGIADRWPPTLA
jgi:hypothetical protein